RHLPGRAGPGRPGRRTAARPPRRGVRRVLLGPRPLVPHDLLTAHPGHHRPGQHHLGRSRRHPRAVPTWAAEPGPQPPRASATRAVLARRATLAGEAAMAMKITLSAAMRARD